MCMYVCMCICIYIYIYMCVCIYIYIYIYRYALMYYMRNEYCYLSSYLTCRSGSPPPGPKARGRWLGTVV